MFELADEVGREHVRLLRALVRAKSVQELTIGADEEDAGRVYCAVGDVKERKLTDRQREAIITWAHGHSIPYVQGEEALSKLETIGFVTSKKHQMVFEGEEPEPDGTWRIVAWTYRVEVTVRARDFLSRRCLCFMLSVFPSRVNRWVVGVLALAAIVGSGWSWVSNLAALAD